MAIFGNSMDARQQRFEELCKIVDQGIAQFRLTGSALKEIRDGQLYRRDFQSFDDCCRKRWRISSNYARRLIDAAEFAEETVPTGTVPQTEGQLRPLRELPREQRIEAWAEAAIEGATPTAIRSAVNRRKPRTAKRVRPIRFRVPGGTVVIEPNKRFTTVEAILSEVFNKIEPTRNAA